MSSEADALGGLADVSNAVVLSPSVDESADACCKRLLAAGDRVLVVSFTIPPARWVRRWLDRVGELPEELVVVTTNDGFGSIDDGDLPGSVAVESLSSPGDLTGIGMLVSKYLERWQDAGRLSVCFDSLTTVLQYEDTRSVYRFLHLITTRLSGSSARAHFHLDPGTQDDRTVSTVVSAFQAVARRTDDGWETERR